MNIHKITVPKSEAKLKLEAYKKRLSTMKIGKANAEIHAEYRAALQGYEALVEGTALIDLEDVIQASPIDEKRRPKLAIARADRKQVRVYQEKQSSQVWYITENSQMGFVNWGIKESSLNILLQSLEPPTEHVSGYALVPMVPLDIRPKTGQLKDWFILWKVEQWADEKLDSTPDIDPYLLKHLGGSLYAVIAEWELTDLERSIMKGRVGQ